MVLRKVFGWDPSRVSPVLKFLKYGSVFTEVAVLVSPPGDIVVGVRAWEREYCFPGNSRQYVAWRLCYSCDTTVVTHFVYPIHQNEIQLHIFLFAFTSMEVATSFQGSFNERKNGGQIYFHGSTCKIPLLVKVGASHQLPPTEASTLRWRLP